MKSKHLIILFFLTALFASHPVQAQHGSKGRHKPASSAATSDCPLIDSIIAFAKTKLGCAYRSGGTGPNSFDCSGFMYYTFDHFGIRLGRSSRDQILMGRKVEKKDIRPGDLVFWYRGKGYVGHAGLVVKVDSAHNFTFIHASTHGKGVRLDESTGDWYARTYAGARRIIECDEQHRARMIQPDGKPSAIAVETPVVRDSAQTATSNQSGTPQKAETHTTPAPKIIYHKIKSGETLTSIAKKYHVTVKQIKQWNHLRSDMIRAGEKLKIHRK
jgi:hypothetical protein